MDVRGMYNRTMSRFLTSLLCGFALMGVTLSSALPASAEQAPDKNGPGVTRVSIVQGSVVVQRGDSNKQVTAVVNAPLLPGDYLSTGTGSRAELQFDGSTAVRLGGNVQARITSDDPNNRQLQLADGTIEFGLVRNTGIVAVDTPSVTVRSGQAGDYRITIGRDGSSWVTVRRGQAQVVTPQRIYTLESGKTLVARGSASNPSITYTTEIGYDSFDDFNAKRDETMVAAITASPNLNPDIAGYDNLGAYGQWQDVAGYGQSWVPNEPSGWSPYGNGSWVWEDGYGWTWVGNEPWGWAPYHYGNWFYSNGYGWAWSPPAYASAPAWSPALVGFFGFGVGVGGPGWGVSAGFGTGGYGGYGYNGYAYPYIGWYPLWPYAPYYPWYPGWSWLGFGWGWPGWGGWGCCGYGGWGWGTNVVNVTHITNIYRYFPHGGVHGTTVGNFQHGTVSGHTFGVDPHNVGGRVGMIHGAVPITPTRDNLGFGGKSVSAPVTLSKAFDSARFAQANRALTGRMPFDQQQKAVAQAIAGKAGQSTPIDRGSVGAHDGAATSHDANASHDATTSHGNAAMSHDAATARDGAISHAPSDPWQRFDQSRGTQEHSARGNTATQSEHGSYSRAQSYGRDSYGRDSYGGESYGRDSYGSSYERNPYGSYSRQSYPSYARGPYGSNQSYGRGSYPSYARGSYPSYAHGSYPSYSRGAQPSYSRAGASPGRGGHPSGGGGGSAHGGGRPPH